MAQAVPETEAPRALGSPHVAPGEYRWYVAGLASWFGAFGMQGVLFSWLVVGELRASAEWVGIAQSASMVPSFLLILIGGAVADHRDRRAILIWLTLAAAVLVGALLAVVAGGVLSLPLLIGYALLLGSLTAFVQPARDSLLSEVLGSRGMLPAVTGVTLVQFLATAAGSLAAGSARWIGIVPALGVFLGVLLLGLPTLWKLRPAPPTVARAMRLADLGHGVREAVRSERMFPVLMLMSAVGLLFMGPFMVIFPLLVRDYYGGDVASLALLSMAFPVGTILGSLAMLRFGEIRRKGRAQLLGLLWGAACLGAVGIGLPFVGALLVVGLFGMGAAVVMNTGRAIFQETATQENRARVLSVFSLGMMGAGGLIGAPMSGLLAEWIGPLPTCVAQASAMALVVAGAALFTDIARQE